MSNLPKRTLSQMLVKQELLKSENRVALGQLDRWSSEVRNTHSILTLAAERAIKHAKQSGFKS